MTKQDQLDYMYNLERFGIKPGLEVMKAFMDALGHPEQKFKTVHVAGTNGKGSTCAFIDSVLRKTGMKVGLYTSPHLREFNERIRVNGTSITDEKLAEFVQRVREAAEEHNIQPTFFEFTTALAFLYFAEENVDIAIVEVGMGGLLDATNVITPLVSVITNIGLDHMEFLGNTKEEIAKEKMGIIKQGVPVVTAETDTKILELIRERCREKEAPLSVVQEMITVRDKKSSLKEQSFEIDAINPLLPPYQGDVTISLLGDHQITNACTALVALYELQKQAYSNPLYPPYQGESVQKGMKDAKWEGRLDVISEKPLIIIDGAHNADGITVLHQFIEKLPRHDVLVYAQKKGKNAGEIGTTIGPLFTHIIVTEGNYEPESAVKVAEELQKYHADVQAIPNVSAALMAGKKLLPNEGMMLITGSLYMVGEALKNLKPKMQKSKLIENLSS